MDSRRWLRPGVVEASVLCGLGLLYMIVIGAGTENGMGYFHQPGHDFTWPLINGALFNGATFYIHGFVLIPRYFMRRRLGRYAAGVALLTAVVIGAKTAGEMVIIAFGMPDLAGLGFEPLALLNLWMLIAYLVLSGIYGVTRYSLARGRAVARLERENTAFELSFLRSQMSPHFLFNALNNLYSLGLQRRVDQVTDGIAQLAALLRFVLYDCQSDTVSLEKEIEFLRRLVSLHRLMLSEDDDVTVTFDVAGEADGLTVAPMLLSPLVENAFKHGLSVEHPSSIAIEIAIDGNELRFEQRNTVRPGAPAESATRTASGVGLANLRKRLELLYPDRYRLALSEADGLFHTTLSLELES
ncbi:MAG: histidine kinase [Acidobacteria bacterium]|nr:histidine kinase [Acidobacteriota bacterium]